MKLIANRPITGDYGTVVPGQDFEPTDERAHDLLKRGLARKKEEPVIQYETKVVTPEAPEVSPRHPFRDVPVPDAEPEDVAPEGDSGVPDADVQNGGNAHSGRRGRRSGSAAE